MDSIKQAYDGLLVMTVGPTPITGTTNGSWQVLFVSGMSNASGNLVITLSVSALSVYWDDFTVGTVNPATPTVSWGQSFGFDGFGNLLTQTPISGSTVPSPRMTLSANATNQITTGGATYDAAGNMTSDGTHTYSFDEMNRLSAFGTYLYTYGVKDNKRLLVYQNATPSTPSATINLYGPDGKRLGAYVYGGSNASWGLATLQNQTNYLYLGNKPLNYADDRVGRTGTRAGVFLLGRGIARRIRGRKGRRSGRMCRIRGRGWRMRIRGITTRVGEGF